MPSRLRPWALFFVVLSVGTTVLLGTLRNTGDGRVEAPRPQVEADAGELPPLPPSSLTVPIQIDLASLLAELEDALPTRWGDIEERIDIPDNDRADFAVALTREHLRASIVESTATVWTMIHYRARGWYDPPLLPEVSASCGTDEDEEAPRLIVELTAPVSVTEDWRLATRASVGRVAAASDDDRDRCEVTFLGFDVTDRVVGAARSFLTSQEVAIDEAVQDVNVRAKFEEWWKLLTEPVQLDDEIWLLLEPMQVHRGGIVGTGETVTVPVALTAQPHVVLGPEPVPQDRPLPPLGEETEVVPGLQIMIDGTAEYPAASERLTTELAGTILEHSGRSVEVVSVTLSGIGGGRLAMEVEIEGDARGRVFLVGKPTYDPETGLVAVPDLEFDVATRNLLLRGATWIADLGIENYLRSRAHWPGAPAVDWVAEKLHEGLNRPLSDGVRLEGSVKDVRIIGVNARRDALVVRAAASAEATLLIASGNGGD